MRLLTSLKTFSKKVLILSVFDIQEFYPSIKEKLLKDALVFAQRYEKIKQKELDLIFHTKKSLLYCKDTPWAKKEGNREFDVTMGSNDRAETCRIVLIV